MSKSQSVALESITATYTDSESDDGVSDQENSNTPKGAPKSDELGRSQENSPKSIESESSSNNASNTGNKNAPPLVAEVTTKVQRLVSYFDDTVVSDDEGSSIPIKPETFVNGKHDMDTNQQSPEHQDHFSDGEADSYGVIIPPEPPGKCSSDLIEKIKDHYKKVVARGLDMNETIQKNKNFRNPSIYEKLIQHCDINELGTNYSPDKFDPFKWGKDSYYDELDKAQKIEMEKLEKARKEKSLRKDTTKIEIVSGTAKRPISAVLTSTEDDAKKRKSKWDQTSSNPAAAVVAGVAKPMVITQPALTTLTASVTATKTTIISAYGSLPKKRL